MNKEEYEELREAVVKLKEELHSELNDTSYTFYRAINKLTNAYEQLSAEDQSEVEPSDELIQGEFWKALYNGI